MGAFFRYNQPKNTPSVSRLKKENKKLLSKIRKDYKGYVMVHMHYKGAIQDIQDRKSALDTMPGAATYIPGAVKNLSSDNIGEAINAVRSKRKEISESKPDSKAEKKSNDTKLSKLTSLEQNLRELKTSMDSRNTLFEKGSFILQGMKADKQVFKQTNQKIEKLGGSAIPFKEKNGKAGASAKRAHPR